MQIFSHFISKSYTVSFAQALPAQFFPIKSKNRLPTVRVNDNSDSRSLMN